MCFKVQFLCFGWLLIIGCNGKQSNSNNAQQIVVESASQSAIDCMSVDLRQLKAQHLLPQPSTVQVKQDPVFHTSKTYQAIDFKEFIEKFLPIYKHLDIAQTQLMFECEDGYNPTMSLQKILEKKAYIAIADADAPAGESWINPTKDAHEMKIAPFYFIYTDVDAKDVTFKWPYNLVKLSLIDASIEQMALYPHEDASLAKGYQLFKTNCLTCHSINKIGGKMGPELNYPKSVIEYWRHTDDIKAFVKAPTKYRNEAKMPAITHLTANDLDQIIGYLKYMAKHKPKS